MYDDCKRRNIESPWTYIWMCSVSEAQVIDKRTHTGRAYGENGKFLKVRLQDGKEGEYLIGTYKYERVSLERKLYVIKYCDDRYGFYDQYDFVPLPASIK